MESTDYFKHATYFDIYQTWASSLLYSSIPSPVNHPKMQIFVKVVNDFQSSTVFAKSSILDVWQGSEYASNQ